MVTTWDGTTKNILDVLSVRELENVAQSAFTTFVFFPNSTESRCAFELQPIFGQFSQFIDTVSYQVRGPTNIWKYFLSCKNNSRSFKSFIEKLENDQASCKKIRIEFLPNNSKIV